MTSNNMVNIYLYTRYERFWHWMQTALILLLLVTGFELNGLFTLFGFKAAVVDFFVMRTTITRTSAIFGSNYYITLAD